MLYAHADIVIVPFPFLEREARKYRPAVVVGRAQSPITPIYWVVMVTGSADDIWPDDIAVTPSAKNGLRKPSLLRMAKVTAVPEEIIVQKLGVLEAPLARSAQKKIMAILGK